MTLMRGAHRVRFAILKHLEDQLPIKIDQANAQWNAGYDLIEPENILPYEPVRMPHGADPILAISIGQARNFVRYDYTPSAEEVYETVYTCRVFVWVFTPSEFIAEDEEITRVATARYRDDYAGVVASTLLEKPMMGQEAMRIEENTLSVAYSDIEQSSNTGIMLAGAFFDFEVRFKEQQYVEALGQVPASGIKTTVFHHGDLDTTFPLSPLAPDEQETP